MNIHTQKLIVKSNYQLNFKPHYFKRKKLYRNSKVKLVTVVEGDQKAPFSIATTARCRGGCYSFPRITPLYP